MSSTVEIETMSPAEVPSAIVDTANTGKPRNYFFCSMLGDCSGKMRYVLEATTANGNTTSIRLDAHATVMPEWPELETFARERPNAFHLEIINPFNWYHKGPFIRLGREHQKIGAIGFHTPRILWSGMNWTGHALKSIDIVADIKNASDLTEALGRTHCADTLTNELHLPELDDKRFDLLADPAKTGKSYILDIAIQEVATAKQGQELTIMSQFMPDGKMAKELVSAAKRGVKITVITNDPTKQPLIAKATAAAFSIFHTLRRNRASLQRESIHLIHPEQFVHGKILLLEDQSVIAGSQNFTEFTTWLGGMREASIRSYHPQVLEAYQKEMQRILLTLRA